MKSIWRSLIVLLLLMPLSPALASDAVAEAYLEHANRDIAAGKYENARHLLEQATDHVDRQIYGDKLYVSAIYNNLGECYRKLAQSEGDAARRSVLLTHAQERLRKAIEIKEEALGTDSIQVAKGLENLAAAYEADDNLIEAEALFRKALQIRERNEGKNSAHTFFDLLELGNIALKGDGTTAEAESYYLRAMSVGKACYPPTDPVIGKCHQQLAFLYYTQTKMDKATMHYDTAISIYANSGPKYRANLQQCKRELKPLAWDLYVTAYRRYRDKLNAQSQATADLIPEIRRLVACCRRLDQTQDVAFLNQLAQQLATRKLPKA